MTLGTVKSRYKHLDRFRVTRKGAGDESICRVQRRRPTTFRVVSPPSEQGKKFRVPSPAKSWGQTTSKVSEHNGVPHRQHKAKRGKNAEEVTSLATLTPEDAYHRTSRSGRPIRHPFRHLPSEGYI